MTFDAADAIRRLRRDAERRAVPLVTAEQEAEWERRKAAALALVTSLVAALVERRITVAEFEQLMRAAIRRSHEVAYAVARGQALTDADVRRIAARVGAQWQYLAAWASALSLGAGGVLLLNGKVTSSAVQMARAKLYVEAAQSSLNAGAVARLGMPDLPAYPGDGTTRCRIYCHCHWRIEPVGAADWNCYWVLGIAEHCEHCPRRALAWAPIRIRNGVLQPYIRQGMFL